MHIHLIVLKTSQPEELVAFYAQIGFQFTNHRHGNGPLHFAAELPGFVLEIYPLPDGIPDNTTRLGFTVPNLEVILATLKDRSHTVKQEPTVTAWGFQAVVMDPDGRKIELKEENTGANKFLIDEKFKLTGRGLVLTGIISAGQIFTGDELIFVANGVVRRRQIVGIDFLRKVPQVSPERIGLLIRCIHDEEIEELRNWNTNQDLALVKNNNHKT